MGSVLGLLSLLAVNNTLSVSFKIAHGHTDTRIKYLGSVIRLVLLVVPKAETSWCNMHLIYLLVAVNGPVGANTPILILIKVSASIHHASCDVDMYLGRLFVIY